MGEACLLRKGLEEPKELELSSAQASPDLAAGCLSHHLFSLSPNHPVFKEVTLLAPDYEVGGGRSGFGQLTRALCSIPTPSFS